MAKILVIEDEDEVRSSIMDLLDSRGYDTITAGNGKEALVKLQDSIPDLIISDIMMPEMDGYSVLDQLQRNTVTASIPFIFLTAKVNTTDLRYGMNKGADDYITKPFKAKDLLIAVETRLEKRKRLNEKFDELRQNIALYVPHELRTPLVAILGFSDLILNDFDSHSSTDIYEMVLRIKKSSKRLYKTIERFVLYSDLLCMSKEDIPLVKLRDSVTEISEMIVNRQVENKFNEQNRLGDLVLSIDQYYLKIPESFLKVLIEELTDNALKFSVPGNLIEITGRNNGEEYVLQILDHGKGFAPEHISQIDAYIQFERDKHQQNGNGLGLTIAKKIAELSGCDIKIDSQIDKYSLIELHIPGIN